MHYHNKTILIDEQYSVRKLQSNLQECDTIKIEKISDNEKRLTFLYKGNSSTAKYVFLLNIKENTFKFLNYSYKILKEVMTENFIHGGNENIKYQSEWFQIPNSLISKIS